MQHSDDDQVELGVSCLKKHPGGGFWPRSRCEATMRSKPTTLALAMTEVNQEVNESKSSENRL